MTEIRSTIESSYKAMVLQFNRRLDHGLQIQSNYTWSKATDNGQGSQTFTTGNVPLDPNDYSFEQGQANFDIRHRFVASVVWNPKFFSSSDDSVARHIFNGFTISPIVQVASGRPHSAFVSGNAPACTNPAICGGSALTAAVSTGILGAGGDNRFPLIERNSIRFPKTVNVDLRVSRRFHFGETMALELLAEGFNVFNHVNVTNRGTRLYSISTASATNAPTLPVGTPILIVDPLFTVPNEAGNTVYRERQIQFAVRFQF
jgi:hypothetical protein